ncbi:MarR family transcriptional regulator [Paenibacillus sp. MMS20-IR301]|uniref:MarR family winged helix-turn-helix transcriptional regulator n=1 Tax=Paenibacillus sp. MMS20-IR301 TaxID=2895946 RepID=UPI0028E7D85A|nr:MarR family transcriptional regulator [Paenibacillus sp. MMS20-IR301]WNS46411.1 MarR family transcriptional regulator [Paenibacillus sp. MMS20-IR301]
MSEEAMKEQAIYKVMDQMANVQRKSQAFVDLITKKGSLSQNQIMLLFQLQLAGTLNITDISERFMITPGAASFMCDKLEDLEYVERVRTKEDRRVVKIVLTAQGKDHILSLFDSFAVAELDNMSMTLRTIDGLMGGIVE